MLENHGPSSSLTEGSQPLEPGYTKEIDECYGVSNHA